MTPQSGSSRDNALFLTPEEPKPGTGGGGLRSTSLLEYLRTKYHVTVQSFTLPHHSKTFAARAWRNAGRFVRGVPPLVDRFAGCENQLDPVLTARRYRAAVIEHFWCAPYADAIRPHCDILALDLHNIESELAATHACAAGGVESILHRRFARAYRKLEREWIPKFDVVLVASEQDRARVEHRANVLAYPNALPVIELPQVDQENAIVFSGNLEYHPNIEAVRWFASAIWPRLRKPGLEWRLAGRNPEAIAHLVKGDATIRVIGPVDDAVVEIAKARVAVVPLLSGSGTRFKILEAWAAGRAVVSTTIGAEGLGAVDGRHLLLADDPESFADAVEKLLDNPAQARGLAAAGRALYLEKYTWPVAWQTLAGHL